MSQTFKKILILLTVILIITFALLGYFFLQSKKTVVNNLFKLIPIDAAIIIDNQNYNNSVSKIINNNLIWQSLNKVPSIAIINTKINYLDSLLKANSNALPLNTNPVLISLHSFSKNSTDALFIVQLDINASEKDVLNIIQNCINKNSTINKRTYENYSIHSISASKSCLANNLNFVLIGDAIALSYSPILIEDALRQYKSKYCLTDIPDFKKVSRTAGSNVDGNVYINFKEFPRFISQFISDKHKRNVATFINFANWGELDLHIKSEQILLNGFITGSDSIGDFIQTFINQSPSEMQFASVIPSNTAAFLAYNIDNYKEWIQSLSVFHQRNGTYSTYKNNFDAISKKYSLNIENHFNDFFDNEAVLVYLDDNNAKLADNTVAYIKVKSRSLANNKMLEIINADAKINGKKTEDYIITINIDRETKVDVFKLPINNFTNIHFGKGFSDLTTNYYIFINNYLVLANNVEVLKSVYYFNLLKKNLAFERNFQSLCEDLNRKSNFLFYFDFNRSKDLQNHFLDKGLLKEIDKNSDNLKNISSIALQLISSRKMIYSNLLVKYDSQFKERAKTVWESRLDTAFNFKPVFIDNHITGEKEIMIQDLKNQLYLINASGRVLWKISLPERIISDIHQVDIYKNNRFQFAFNSENYLFIIDRNGNFLDRFPVKLRATATNALSIFDYDNSREYRIFIACNDHKIYCYSTDGNIIPGWEFDKSDAYIYQPIQHFRFGNKDFIVFSDSLKSYIVDRRGNERVKVKELFPKNRNSRFFADNKEKDNEKFITSDIEGNVISINLNGNITKTSLGKFSAHHYFSYTDITGNGNFEYCFLDENTFKAFDNNNKLILDYKFSKKITSVPAHYIFPNNNRRIGFVGHESILLIDSKGNLHPGFPLTGITMFSIGKLSSDVQIFNLLVGNKDGFLYNYEVYY